MEYYDKSVEITMLFRDIMGLMKHHLSKMFENGKFTAPQGMIIGILSKMGKMKISELSSKLDLSNSTVSDILDRLEKQGMVERERSEEDKRVVYVGITDKFKESHQNFHEKAELKIQKIMKDATNEDLEKVIIGMNTLIKILKDN